MSCTGPVPGREPNPGTQPPTVEGGMARGTIPQSVPQLLFFMIPLPRRLGLQVKQA
jgi:hypothetical protein